MARLAREISENGLYHIVFRGVNRRTKGDADKRGRTFFVINRLGLSGHKGRFCCVDN